MQFNQNSKSRNNNKENKLINEFKSINKKRFNPSNNNMKSRSFRNLKIYRNQKYQFMRQRLRIKNSLNKSRL